MPRCADSWPAGRLRAASLGLLLLATVSFQGATAAAAAPGVDAAPASGAPSLDEREALRASQAVIGRMPPDYTLHDVQGRPVKLSSFHGKPLLLSFIYTGCFQVCPLNTRSLLEAVKGLDRLLTPDQFNVASIGFNQPFDSPQAMRDFAARHRIEHRNWHFLSPPPASVEALTRDIGFSYVATPAGFDHVLGVTVLDAEGRIYSQVYGERTTADKLGEPLRQLLTQSPLPQQLRLADVIERVRILCTVYDPETGEYRYNYTLILEVIGGLGFFVAMAGYFLHEWRQRRRARRRVLALQPLQPVPPPELLQPPLPPLPPATALAVNEAGH